MRAQASSPGIGSFSLVEVALAMAILAVGMVGVLSLLPVGLDSARQVHNETVATQIARTAIGNLWLSNRATQTFQINFPDQLLDQDGQTNANVNSHYFRLRIQNTFTNSNSARYFLTLEWPARAPSNAPLVQKRAFVTEVVRP